MSATLRGRCDASARRICRGGVHDTTPRSSPGTASARIQPTTSDPPRSDPIEAILSAVVPAPNPWLIELIVVLDASHNGTDRRSISRDAAAGLLLRLRRGVYVERIAFEAMTPEARHLVRMRALAEVSPGPVVFSHFSAALVHGLPVLRERLGAVHTVVGERAGRGQEGVSGHLFAVSEPEVERHGPLLVTSARRTVIDVTGAAPLEEGAMVVDAALRAGVPREALSEAAEVAGPRRAARRTTEAIAFGHPGSESAAESLSRVTALRIGVEPPELQHPIRLRSGRTVFLDRLFRSVRAGSEIDGSQKYLDPKMARDGTAAALLKDKRREDEMRPHLTGLARWGWAESRSRTLMRPLLAAIGVHPVGATLADYAAAARHATPRRNEVQR